MRNIDSAILMFYIKKTAWNGRLSTKRLDKTPRQNAVHITKCLRNSPRRMIRNI